MGKIKNPKFSKYSTPFWWLFEGIGLFGQGGSTGNVSLAILTKGELRRWRSKGFRLWRLCFFEGTPISVGRGTEFPFQIVGAPFLEDHIFPYITKKDFCFGNRHVSSLDCLFMPKSRQESKYPKFKNTKCVGLKFNVSNTTCLNSISRECIDIDLIINFYKIYPNKNIFFNKFFNKLAGNSSFQKKIKSGWSAEDIRGSWEKDLNDFLEIRKKYLIYSRD